MARHPPRGADPRDWRATVHRWFKIGVLDHINAHEFDEHNELVRDDVVEEFDLLAHMLADGRLHRLVRGSFLSPLKTILWLTPRRRAQPPLHDDDEDEHNDMFWQLKALLFRHQRRVSQAHSLSRRGFSGSQLTAQYTGGGGRVAAGRTFHRLSPVVDEHLLVQPACNVFVRRSPLIRASPAVRVLVREPSFMTFPSWPLPSRVALPATKGRALCSSRTGPPTSM